MQDIKLTWLRYESWNFTFLHGSVLDVGCYCWRERELFLVSELKRCIIKPSVFVERASLNLISGLGMARAVSRGSVTAEALVHLLTSPCEIGIGWSGIRTLFSPVTLVFPFVTVVAQVLHTHSFVFHRLCVILAVVSIVKQNFKEINWFFYVFCAVHCSIIIQYKPTKYTFSKLIF